VTVTDAWRIDGIEKNDSYKSYRGHEGLSFGDLDLELEVNLDIDSVS